MSRFFKFFIYEGSSVWSSRAKSCTAGSPAALEIDNTKGGCCTCCHTSTQGGITHPPSLHLSSGQTVDQSLAQYDAVYPAYRAQLSFTCCYPLFQFCRPHGVFHFSVFPSIIWLCECLCVLALKIQSSQCPVRCMAFYSYLTVLMVHIGMEAMHRAGSTARWTMDSCHLT